MDASREFGFYRTLNVKIKELLMHKVKGSLEVYESVEDLVQDISRKVSPDVKLYNTQKLFIYFGGMLVLFLLMFIVELFLFRLLGKTIHRPVRRRTQIRTFYFRQHSCILSGTNLRESLNLARRVITRHFKTLKNLFVRSPVVTDH